MKRALLAALALTCLPAPSLAAEPVPGPHLVGPPEVHYAPTEPNLYPGWVWLAGTALPSPATAFGSGAPSFGLRWQVTPLLWSFGVHRATSPWRILVVDPIARVSGSIELYGGFDWFFGSVHDTLIRPGIRTTLPVFHRGEYLSVFFGTSLYDRVGTKVAYDAGFSIFSGFLGASATWAPEDERVRAIATIHLRVLH